MLEEDRLMLDRSPDEMGSNGLDDDLLDSDTDDDMMAETTDGERIIYPWMKKIHVAGVGKFILIFFLFSDYSNNTRKCFIFKGNELKLSDKKYSLFVEN